MADDTSGASRPKTLLIFDNPDKMGARPSGVDEAMPKWPFRLLASGPPGCGKRNLILNLIYRLHPPPSAIHICHIDAADTTEYEVLEDLGVPMFYYQDTDFPSIENITDPEPPVIGDTETGPIELEGGKLAGKEPAVELEAPDEGIDMASDPLVIIDEITTDMLSPEGKTRWERLMNYGSSHKNTSVICSIQSCVNIPPKVRRAFNNYVLWKQPDKTATTMAATRAGVPPAMLEEMFDGLCEDPHDSIWVDTTQPPDSPWRFRLNMLTPIRAAETVHTADYEQ